MKAPITFALFLSLAALAAVPLSAQVESLKIEPTFVPPLSPSMRLDGVTEGKLIVAISVSSEGRLNDWLVLGYTHRGLVDPCIEAMKEWRFTPARLNGVPVPTQTEVTIHYTAVGVVISHSTVGEVLNARLDAITGLRMIEHPCSARELDGLPARINTVQPLYAKAAEDQGVRGKVQVHFYIDQTGAVRMPAVNADANPYLSDIAVSAVRAWRFQPPMSHGSPVLVAAVQAFNFGR